MSTWKKIDVENWTRREHFEYYTKILKVQYNMTANIKVEKLLDYCHQNGKKVLCVAALSGVKDRKQH